MFSMFGRTGAPIKRGPPHKHKKILNTVHSSDDNYCACRVKAVAGGIHIIGAPTFFF